MIERFSDGLKKAADRAKDFMTSEESKKPGLFVEFLEALKTAAGSAHQLAHTQENPRFLFIRDTIEKIIEIGQQLPLFNDKQAGIWFQIKTSLLGIEDQGRRMAQSKALSRQSVLEELDIRKKLASDEINK